MSSFNTAKDREHYVQAWREHVQELASLYLAASTPDSLMMMSEEYGKLRNDLFALIEVAAQRQNFDR